ncbi:hypothetical protein Ahy_A09g043453 [Arachis hypogaea]|uniref:uridine/cytidine kinase n=1 Tax=Arachis hypogaea TaxID=3818 RepID=A0A445BIA5_ARAHY|nr:hypothetical protein Ahy_A09g043453 [Arachis hypogaea]
MTSEFDLLHSNVSDNCCGNKFCIFMVFDLSSLISAQVNASDVIILEGILVFHDQDVRDLMNMKIFVNTDADVRLARRIRRDTVERGRDINSVLEQYAKFVKPAFDDFVLPSKKYADVTVPRGGDNHVAINLIVQHIRTKLGQHDLPCNSDISETGAFSQNPALVLAPVVPSNEYIWWKANARETKEELINRGPKFLN